MKEDILPCLYASDYNDCKWFGLEFSLHRQKSFKPDLYFFQTAV